MMLVFIIAACIHQSRDTSVHVRWPSAQCLKRTPFSGNMRFRTLKTMRFLSEALPPEQAAAMMELLGSRDAHCDTQEHRNSEFLVLRGAVRYGIMNYMSGVTFRAYSMEQSCIDAGDVINDVLSGASSIDPGVMRVALLTGDFHTDINIMTGDPLKDWACNSVARVMATCPATPFEAAEELRCGRR